MKQRRVYTSNAVNWLIRFQYDAVFAIYEEVVQPRFPTYKFINTIGLQLVQDGVIGEFIDKDS